MIRVSDLVVGYLLAVCILPFCLGEFSSILYTFHNLFIVTILK